VKLLLVLFMMALVGSPLLVAAPLAVANDSEIEVLQQRAESDFPNGLRFYVEARSPDEIEDVRVFFRKLGQTSRSGYRTVDFAPGSEIQGESLVLSGRGGEYIPPGTRIEYSFEIRDQGGRVFRTEDEVFVYTDNRFNWETVSDGLITVYHYGTGSRERARLMLEGAQETLERMRPVLGVDPTNPLHIVAYSSYPHMRDALPFRSQAVSDHLITQGVAFSEERVLLVLADHPGYLGTTSHEFVHLLVADATGRAIARVPVWLNEGLAEHGNIEASAEYDNYLARAIERGEVRPLWHQGTFSGTPTEIITAYGQGKAVINYMVTTYGDEKMAELLRALTRTFDIDAALEEVYGFNQHGLDTEWRLSRGMEPLPAPEPRQVQRPPTPTPRPSAQADPAPTAVPQIEEAPAPTEAAPEHAPTQEQPASPGCLAPGLYGAQVVANDLTLLLIIGGPLAMLGARAWRRRVR
jgi:hypothetical protein